MLRTGLAGIKPTMKPTGSHGNLFDCRGFFVYIIIIAHVRNCLETRGWLVSAIRSSKTPNEARRALALEALCRGMRVTSCLAHMKDAALALSVITKGSGRLR